MTRDVAICLSDLRAAVMTGDFSQLEPIAAGLEDVLGTVSPRSLDEAERLRAEAARTAACLEAALSGLHAARRRIAEIADVAAGLTTYQRDGSKSTYVSPAPSLRRL